MDNIELFENILYEVENTYSGIKFSNWQSKDGQALFIKEKNSVDNFFPDLTKHGFKRSRKDNSIWWTNREIQKTRLNVSAILAEVEKPDPKKDKIKNHLSVLENL